MGSGFGDGVAVLCGVGLRVAIADGVIWCWDAGAGLYDGVAMLCGAGLQVLGSAMEIGETEMRDERQRRESEINYYYFFTILATVQFYV